MMNIDIENGNGSLPLFLNGEPAGKIMVQFAPNHTVVAFMPSKEDMEALLAGRPVLLKIYGNFIPAIKIYTVDENGEDNS